jgi:hypothetical protein
MTTTSTETIIETIMGECESIISSVEDFLEENSTIYSDATLTLLSNDLDDFEEIRYTAEGLQDITLGLDTENLTEESKMVILKEVENLSIELYQEIKYNLEYLVDELEIFDHDLEYFKNLRFSINTIRSLFV